MVYHIVAPPNPLGPWFVQTWICSIAGSFCVNLNFSGFVRFLKRSTLFLHFCECLPFEQDLALDLYNFKFPLPKDDLYQV
jgi:hypothetical protein